MDDCTGPKVRESQNLTLSDIVDNGVNGCVGSEGRVRMTEKNEYCPKHN